MVWRRVSQTRFADEHEQEEFLTELEQSLEMQNFNAATELCDGDRRALPQLAMYAINNRELGYEKVRRRVAERFQQDVMSDIEHRLSWVTTVIKSAPMIGLLGTVMGMMGAFSNLSSGEKVDTIQMASRHPVRPHHHRMWLSNCRPPSPLHPPASTFDLRRWKTSSALAWDACSRV